VSGKDIESIMAFCYRQYKAGNMWFSYQSTFDNTITQSFTMTSVDVKILNSNGRIAENIGANSSVFIKFQFPSQMGQLQKSTIEEITSQEGQLLTQAQQAQLVNPFRNPEESAFALQSKQKKKSRGQRGRDKKKRTRRTRAQMRADREAEQTYGREQKEVELIPITPRELELNYEFEYEYETGTIFNSPMEGALLQVVEEYGLDPEFSTIGNPVPLPTAPRSRPPPARSRALPTAILREVEDERNLNEFMRTLAQRTGTGAVERQIVEDALQADTEENIQEINELFTTAPNVADNYELQLRKRAEMMKAQEKARERRADVRKFYDREKAERERRQMLSNTAFYRDSPVRTDRRRRRRGGESKEDKEEKEEKEEED
jgi:hypothetical protein